MSPEKVNITHQNVRWKDIANGLQAPARLTMSVKWYDNAKSFAAPIKLHSLPYLINQSSKQASNRPKPIHINIAHQQKSLSNALKWCQRQYLQKQECFFSWRLKQSNVRSGNFRQSGNEFQRHWMHGCRRLTVYSVVRPSCWLWRTEDRHDDLLTVAIGIHNSVKYTSTST